MSKKARVALSFLIAGIVFSPRPFYAAAAENDGQTLDAGQGIEPSLNIVPAGADSLAPLSGAVNAAPPGLNINETSPALLEPAQQALKSARQAPAQRVAQAKIMAASIAPASTLLQSPAPAAQHPQTAVAMDAHPTGQAAKAPAVPGVLAKTADARALAQIARGRGVSANLDALFDQETLLNRSEDGQWVAARPTHEAFKLARAAAFLKNRGIDLPFKSIRVSKQPGPESARDASALVLLARELKSVMGLGSEDLDGLVRLLLGKHLELGVAQPLRLSPNETARAGLGPESSASADGAIEAFRAAWLKKFPRFLRALKRSSKNSAAPAEELTPLLSVMRSAFTAPNLNKIFFQRAADGAVQVKDLGPEGRVAWGEQSLKFGAGTLKGVFFNPADKSVLFIGSIGRGYRLERRLLEPDGKIGNTSESLAINGPPDARVFYDAPSRNLIFVGGRSIETFEVLEHSVRPKARIETPETWSAAAYDSTLRILFLADAQNRQIAAWRVSAEGALIQGPKSPASRPLGNLFAIPARKTLLAYDPSARRYEVFSVDQEGRAQDLEKSIAFPTDVSGENTTAIGPSQGAIYALGYAEHVDRNKIIRDHVLYRFSPDSEVKNAQFDPFWDHSGPAPPAVDALAAKIGGLTRAGASKIAELASAGGRRWMDLFWSALSRHVLSGGEAANDMGGKNLWSRIFPKRLADDELTPIAEAQSWFDEKSQAQIRERMPTLWSLLADPKRLPRFLAALSFLRLNYGYDLNHARSFAGGDTPIAWAQAHHAVFPLNELRIVPVSSSFRRHIIYVEDKEGMFAVELKMPGQNPDRLHIEPENFRVAKDLWEHAPEDPGVVKPIYFGQFSGDATLYGKNTAYHRDRPLGLLLFSYDDGERFQHAAPLMKEIAAERNISYRDVLNQVATDATVAALRLHRLGWSGSSGGGLLDSGFTDMHDENIRVTRDGRGVLVADFGVFSREPIGMEERRRQTRRQLGYVNVSRDLSALYEAIYPEVVRRLTQGIDDEAERAAIMEDVRQELARQTP